MTPSRNIIASPSPSLHTLYYSPSTHFHTYTSASNLTVIKYVFRLSSAAHESIKVRDQMKLSHPPPPLRAPPRWGRIPTSSVFFLLSGDAVVFRSRESPGTTNNVLVIFITGTPSPCYKWWEHSRGDEWHESESDCWISLVYFLLK